MERKSQQQLKELQDLKVHLREVNALLFIEKARNEALQSVLGDLLKEHGVEELLLEVQSVLRFSTGQTVEEADRISSLYNKLNFLLRHP